MFEPTSGKEEAAVHLLRVVRFFALCTIRCIALTAFFRLWTLLPIVVVVNGVAIGSRFLRLSTHM